MSKETKTRRHHSAAFKSKVALEALKEQSTLAELVAKYELHPVQITQWKKQLIDSSPEVFSTAAEKKKEDPTALIETLYQKIGQYQIELDWLKKKSGG